MLNEKQRKEIVMDENNNDELNLSGEFDELDNKIILNDEEGN